MVVVEVIIIIMTVIAVVASSFDKAEEKPVGKKYEYIN